MPQRTLDLGFLEEALNAAYPDEKFLVLGLTPNQWAILIRAINRHILWLDKRGKEAKEVYPQERNNCVVIEGIIAHMMPVD